MNYKEEIEGLILKLEKIQDQLGEIAIEADSNIGNQAARSEALISDAIHNLQAALKY